MTTTQPEPFIRQEISAMAKIGQQSGELDQQESKILTQMLSAKDVPVTAIMTPRTVVFSLPMTMTIGHFVEAHSNCPFTRVPIYKKDTEDIQGYVNRNDLVLASHQQEKAPISVLMRSLLVVQTSAKMLPLFELMIRRNTQIAMTVDEYGSIGGIVTQEDIIESLLGLEIVDLNDPAVDMQQLARTQWKRRMHEKGIVFSDDG